MLRQGHDIVIPIHHGFTRMINRTNTREVAGRAIARLPDTTQSIHINFDTATGGKGAAANPGVFVDGVFESAEGWVYVIFVHARLNNDDFKAPVTAFSANGHCRFVLTEEVPLTRT